MRWPVVLIGIVLILAVVVFAVSYGLPNTASTSAATASTAEIIPGIPSVPYEDPQYGFILSRPATASTTETGFEQYLPVTLHSVAGVILPKSISEGTNLIESALYIGASSDPQAVNACASAAETEHPLGTKLINGNVFQVFASTGAAAGNVYEKTAYRTVRNGTCFEIVELMHSGSIGNYSTGTIKQYDPAMIRNVLDKMLATFLFTGKSGSGVQGKVFVRCPDDVADPACQSQIRVVEAYQGISAVALFKTSPDGSFSSQLPPGQYELRVDTATSTRCASVGVVVTDTTFITTDISCVVAEE